MNRLKIESSGFIIEVESNTESLDELECRFRKLLIDLRKGII